VTAERSGALVVSVRGDLDMVGVPPVRAAIGEALRRRGRRRLILDLTAVGFLGGHGLRIIADTVAATAQAGHGRLPVVVGGSRCVLRSLHLTGLRLVLARHDTVDDALVTVPALPGRAPR